MTHVMVQMSFGPRPTGSIASQKTGDYIIQSLESFGWSTEVQDFVYRGTKGRNIIGKRGAESGNIIIVAAHYDTRRRADRDSLSPLQPVPGANDGASGVAVLLELAAVLDQDKLQDRLWLVFFDAEDDGDLDDWEWTVGSQQFAAYLKTPVKFVIVIDMIGDENQQLFMEANSDRTLSAAIWSTAAELGYEDYFIPSVKYSILDDHTPFLSRNIPAIDIIDFDYPYWHTVEDTADKLLPVSLERVGRVLELFLETRLYSPPVGQGATP